MLPYLHANPAEGQVNVSFVELYFHFCENVTKCNSLRIPLYLDTILLPLTDYSNHQRNAFYKMRKVLEIHVFCTGTETPNRKMLKQTATFIALFYSISALSYHNSHSYTHPYKCLFLCLNTFSLKFRWMHFKI